MLTWSTVEEGKEESIETETIGDDYKNWFFLNDSRISSASRSDIEDT